MSIILKLDIWNLIIIGYGTIYIVFNIILLAKRLIKAKTNPILSLTDEEIIQEAKKASFHQKMSVAIDFIWVVIGIANYPIYFMILFTLKYIISGATIKVAPHNGTKILNFNLLAEIVVVIVMMNHVVAEKINLEQLNDLLQ